jgi:hypothetical protein
MEIDVLFIKTKVRLEHNTGPIIVTAAGAQQGNLLSVVSRFCPKFSMNSVSTVLVTAFSRDYFPKKEKSSPLPLQIDMGG